MIRKTVALLLIILLLCPALPGMATEEYHFLFRTENFQADANWKLKDNGSAYKNCPAGNYFSNSVIDSQAKADIYIPEDGYFTIWAMVMDYDDKGFGTRHGKIGFDGLFSNHSYNCSEATVFTWSAAPPTAVTKGWHTLDMKVGKGSWNVAAVYVTNTATNPAETDIFGYQDTKAPVFNSEIKATRTADGYEVQFPEATDESGHTEVVYYKDGETFEEKEGKYLIFGLAELESVTISAKASDYVGNSETISRVLTVSELEVDAFTLTDTEGNAVLSHEDLKGKDDISAKLSLYTADTEKNVFMAVTVYTKNFDRIVKTETVTAPAQLLQSVPFTLPEAVAAAPEEYVLQAVVWNDGSIRPFVKAITIAA